MMVPHSQKPLAIASLTARLKKTWVAHGIDPDGEEGRNLIDYNISSAAHRAHELARFCELSFGLTMSGRDVIDLGCGFGMLGTKLVLDHAARSLRLVDQDKEYIAAAAAMATDAGLAGVTVTCCSLDDYEIPEESADVILLIDLFHLRRFDHAAVLARCRRALRRGGVMLGRTTNRVTAMDQATMVEATGMLAPGWADRFVRWRTAGRVTCDDRMARAPADVAQALACAGFANLRLMMRQGYRLDEPISHRAAPFAPFFYFGAQRLG